MRRGFFAALRRLAAARCAEWSFGVQFTLNSRTGIQRHPLQGHHHPQLNRMTVDVTQASL
ncbi:protein of unknown function [Methylocella tundrae]|uniref:Uncharacterized protein n=1 Tax=Methylocella tundrae TaxID=227605 RepID=A0A4U8Z6C0_METTU|nr:protein of unknown function [Methylocella tundrae]